MEDHKKSDLGNEGKFNMDGWNESPDLSSKLNSLILFLIFTQSDLKSFIGIGQRSIRLLSFLYSSGQQIGINRRHPKFVHTYHR